MDIAKAAVGPSIAISGKSKSNEDDKRSMRRPPSPSPTKKPSYGLLKIKRNPERANFIVIRTLQSVYHSRQLDALHKHGAASIDMALDWYLMALSDTILSWRKDATVSTFAWSANMINGPEKAKSFNLKFDKEGKNPFWEPYTDSDGQHYGTR